MNDKNKDEVSIHRKKYNDHENKYHRYSTNYDYYAYESKYSNDYKQKNQQPKTNRTKTRENNRVENHIPTCKSNVLCNYSVSDVSIEFCSLPNEPQRIPTIVPQPRITNQNSRTSNFGINPTEINKT